MSRSCSKYATTVSKSPWWARSTRRARRPWASGARSKPPWPQRREVEVLDREHLPGRVGPRALERDLRVAQRVGHGGDAGAARPTPAAAAGCRPAPPRRRRGCPPAPLGRGTRRHPVGGPPGRQRPPIERDLERRAEPCRGSERARRAGPRCRAIEAHCSRAGRQRSVVGVIAVEQRVEDRAPDRTLLREAMSSRRASAASTGAVALAAARARRAIGRDPARHREPGTVRDVAMQGWRSSPSHRTRTASARPGGT